MQDVALARTGSQRHLDRIVRRAALDVGTPLGELQVYEVSNASILGIYDAVRVAREDRDAAIAAQFHGVREQLVSLHRTAIARAWWTSEACAARAAALRARLPELRERDGHLDLELAPAA